MSWSRTRPIVLPQHLVAIKHRRHVARGILPKYLVRYRNVGDMAFINAVARTSFPLGNGSPIGFSPSNKAYTDTPYFDTRRLS